MEWKVETNGSVNEVVSAKSTMPIWEKIQAHLQSVPESELAQVPADGAMEHDHYLYGEQKKAASKTKHAIVSQNRQPKRKVA